MPDAPTHRRRGEIGLGDLTRALHELDTRDAASVSRIARCLGFSGMDTNPPEAMHGAYEQRLRRPFPREAPPEPLRGFQLPPSQPPQPDLPQETLETNWEELAPSRLNPRRAGWRTSRRCRRRHSNRRRGVRRFSRA
jgi:hypothetical protein